MNLRNLLKTFLILMLMGGVTLASSPSDVSNLQATPRDGAIDLTWDDASDDDGIILSYVVYYGTTSIYETDAYSDFVDTKAAEANYTIEGLTNGVNYYFAVTAVDEEDNESENYSDEVFAMPMSEAIETPSVISASQITLEEVEVVMSEPVAVKSRTQSFFIVNKDDPMEEVDLIDASVEGAKVYLEVATNGFKPGVAYEITATSAVEDLDGNPVSSGVTDTAVFIAKSAADFVIADPIVEIDDEDVLEPGERLPVVEEPVEETTKTTEPVHEVAPEVDQMPPADATGLIMDSSTIEENGKATLFWTPSSDTDGDVIDQVLYVKEGNQNWDEGYSIGKDTGMEELSVELDTTYLVRIVTVDKSGNQSNGVTLTFSTQLSKTGPSNMLFFLGAVAVIGFLFMMKRRQV